MAGDDDDRVYQVHNHPDINHLDVGGGWQRVKGRDEDGTNGHHNGCIHSNNSCKCLTIILNLLHLILKRIERLLMEGSIGI